MRNILVKLAIIGAMSAVGMFGADNVMLGTWKYDMSKSTLPGNVKGRTDVREEAPDGAMKITRTDQMADGSSKTYSWTFKFDGKEYPVTGAPFDTVSAKRIGENKTAYTVRKTGGKYHSTGEYVYSKDGKTLTTKSSGTDAEGKPLRTLAVALKQ